MLKNQWFWICVGSFGYLVSLYAILLGMGYAAAGAALLLPIVPLCCPQFSIDDRLKASTSSCAISYMVLLVLLVNNSYFPSTMAMVIELFFILLITIPAFLIRTPMYLLFGSASVDAILMVSGFAFLMFFLYAIVYLPRLQERTLKMLLSIVCVSVFITFNECINLGMGISELSKISNEDATVRNYYRVAVK